MTGTPDPDRLGRALLPRYRLDRTIGAGGMATVHLAEDLKHRRKVAIKVLRPELAAAVGAERFISEIRTTAGLQHPHILPLFDSGEDGGFLWYAMPYIRGESLRERLDRDGPLPLDLALDIARKVAGALQAAHDEGIVHRDIKPANVLLDDHDEPLVADFGVALALSQVGAERLTATGLSPGTPAYMSPEQLSGDRDVDGRTDVYALGALLFEMLTGHAPFQGPNLRAVMTAVLTGPPPPLREERPDVSAETARAVARALATDPEDRFPSPGAFATTLRTEPGVGARRRLPTLGLIGVATLVAVGASFQAWASSRRADARASAARAEELVDEGRYLEAYALAEGAERWLPDDSTLETVFLLASDLLTVVSDPPGSEVFVQRFDPEAPSGTEPIRIGRTPLSGHRIPRSTHRVVARLEGHGTVERLASSEYGRDWNPEAVGRVVELYLTLPPDTAPGDVLHVPGGAYELTNPDVPIGLSAALDAFRIDRFEVTNEAYADFVRDGGYTNRDLQAEVPEGVRASLVDRTGLPGPAGWSRQRFPDGAGRLPVTEVSWWEAQAFCRHRGGRLPTVFEWEKTARDGRRSRRGVFMPWGLETASGVSQGRANFNSDGPVEVDAHPFGMSPYGAYAMAGNVREWTLNPSGPGRAVTGGSWQGPAYLSTEYTAEPASTRSPGIGFRCAAHDGSGDQGGGPVDLEPQTPEYQPVDSATFESLRAFYRYDRVPPEPRVTEVEETDDWIRERIWVDAPGGDSVLVYFYAPRSAAPPYQTIVYAPSVSAFFEETVPYQVEFIIGPVIQGGRGVVVPVMTGMVGRSVPDAESLFPEPSSVRFREIMVLHATELRVAVDYAETREDVDRGRFAYVGMSWGAGSRLLFAAIDDRYQAVVFIGAGIDERMKPTLPEADNVNFAPYIRAPILVVNGTNDEEHPWATRGRAVWELLPEPKELVLVDGAGHLPPVEARIPAINRFLDRVLGPVRR